MGGKILIVIGISIAATTFMSMFLAGCTSNTDKEYEDVEQLKYIEEWNKMRKNDD